MLYCGAGALGRAGVGAGALGWALGAGREGVWQALGVCGRAGGRCRQLGTRGARGRAAGAGRAHGAADWAASAHLGVLNWARLGFCAP